GAGHFSSGCEARRPRGRTARGRAVVMNVLILHTATPDERDVDPARRVWEFDVDGAARAVAAVIPEAAIARVLGEPREVLDLLDRHAPDVVYNLCEAPLARPDREAHIAALFEWA